MENTIEMGMSVNVLDVDEDLNLDEGRLFSVAGGVNHYANACTHECTGSVDC